MHVRLIALATPLLLNPHALQAQNAPNLAPAAYTAVSSTAMGVTGDIRTAPAKLIFRGHPFTLKMQQVYSGEQIGDVSKMFSVDASPDSRAALYRVAIPGDLKLAHGNTFCGGTETSFVVLLQKGADLEVAGFSGSAVPDVWPAALNNSRSLCGTYGYTRR